MKKPERQGRSGRYALDALDRKVSLSGTQSYCEAAEHIDEAYDQQQEEGRGGGLLDEDKFDDHAEKQNE
jgi:hypothetical protein